LVSAILTAIGIAVLNIDSQSLATVLLVAGAGLAAIVILFSSQIAPISTTPRDRLAGHAMASAAQTPTQFPELLQSSSHPALDRAVWAKLTAHMSHELRTPLNAVLGFSELMSNEVFGPLGSSCYGDYVRDIHASGRSLLKSAEDALAITALLTSPERKGPPQSCCLNSVLDDARAFAAPDLGARSIGVTCELAADLNVIGDVQVMRQMLINLIAEASRIAKDGAVLRIEAIDMKDTVNLSVALDEGDADKTSESDAFPMILARTLCELSGAVLTASEARGGGRVWNVQFLAATQNDLFQVWA
jgi:two-component system cell cycle sensor histidine kinase PleC